MNDTAVTPEQLLLRDALEMPDDVHVRMLSREPLGAGSVAGFEVPGADGSGPVVHFVDTSRRTVARETGMLVGTPDRPKARVWLHPADPHLPALAPVAFSHSAQTLLARLDMELAGPAEMIAYRPGRRAVLRMPTTGGIRWLKVVPPARVAHIVATHRELADHGIPLPALHGWSGEGLLVLGDAAGTPVSEADWQADALLDEVDRLRDAVAAVPLAHRARTGLRRRLEWYAPRLVVLESARTSGVEDIVAHVRARWGGGGVPRTIHGDLHYGQLFLGEDGAISAVIDIDTAGSGSAVADTGAFLAHAIASAVLTPPPSDERVWRLARAGLRRWDDADGALRSRAATHLLGHALGAAESGDDARAARLLAAAAALVGIGPEL